MDLGSYALIFCSRFCAVKRGRNEINRRSLDSSVTIPHEATYRNLDQNRPVTNSNAEAAFNFCGCGWPQNMLIPKGNVEGFACQLFVMVTNGAVDQVRTHNIEHRVINCTYNVYCVIFKFCLDRLVTVLFKPLLLRLSVGD